MKSAIAALSLLLGILPAAAEDRAPEIETQVDAASGRYEMQPVEGGIARLDTLTGAVSLCRIEAASMSCDTSSEERATFEDRMDEMAERLTAVEADRGGDLARAPAASLKPSEDAEFDAALGRMMQVFRTFSDLVRELDRDVGRSETPTQPDRT